MRVICSTTLQAVIAAVAVLHKTKFDFCTNGTSSIWTCTVYVTRQMIGTVPSFGTASGAVDVVLIILIECSNALAGQHQTQILHSLSYFVIPQ